MTGAGAEFAFCTACPTPCASLGVLGLVVFPILTCVMQFGIIYAVDEKVRLM